MRACCLCSQVVVEEGGDAASVKLGAAEGSQQAQLDGFKVRSLKATVQLWRRWHYETTWACMPDYRPPTPAHQKLLFIGDMSRTLPYHGSDIVKSDEAVALVSGRWHSAIFAAWLQRGSAGCAAELWVVHAAVNLLQVQVKLATPTAVWLCTLKAQSVLNSSSPSHAGVWGLARTCRREHPVLPVCCCDVDDVVCVISHSTLQLPSGSVRGLKICISVEPEAAFRFDMLFVPRLVVPHNAQLTTLNVSFEAVCRLLNAHTSRTTASLEMERLCQAYELLEDMCQHYLHDAIHPLPQSNVPAWHHKLLYAWCAEQSAPLSSSSIVTTANVLAVHPDCWSEVQLVERCGPWLADTLLGLTPYQELLFPSGSMLAVQPVYETSPTSVFYNGCVVAVAAAILELLPMERHIVALEVGAGTGGTASSLVAILDGVCARYVFTDVSDFFLRQARVRFAESRFVVCALLNIEADPCLQGFISSQCDVILQPTRCTRLS